MEDMEVLETEQETEVQTEETTQEQTEQVTENQTEETTQEQTEQDTDQETSLISEMPSLADNAIHEMFYVVGVDLDYVPKSEGEMFTMGCQAVCALFFIWLFFRTLFQFIREMGKGV